MTEPIDKNAILDAAAKIKIEKSNLHWHDWERYSARQNSRMKFGGYLGDIVFSGNLVPFLPYIKMGEFLHVGKQTTSSPRRGISKISGRCRGA
ncbi:MAG: CRISPR system precrRNA processing endoribonuclease RAMP protein Cas6 [Desulfatirhabdiaceae bacterium]